MRTEQRSKVLLLGVVAAAAMAGLVLTGRQPFALVAGLPLLLVMPGVAVVEATVPSRAIAWSERLPLYGVGSLAVLIVGGLGLSAAHVGVHRLSVTSLCAAVTVVGLLVALRRSPAAVATAPAAVGAVRARRLGDDDDAVTVIRPATWLTRRMSVALVGVAALALGAAAVGSVQSERHALAAEQFTALFAVPNPVSDPHPTTAQVGVVSHEQTAQVFHVEIVGATTGGTARRDVVVPANGSETLTVPVAGERRVTVRLFRGDATTPERTLEIEGGL